MRLQGAPRARSATRISGYPKEDGDTAADRLARSSLRGKKKLDWLPFRLRPESRLAPVLFRVRSIVIPFARSSRYVTVEYWAEDPLRLYLNANGSGNIALRAGLNHGKQPAFILKGNAQTKSPRRPVVAARAN